MLCSVYREDRRTYDYYRCPQVMANTRSGPVGILSAIPKLPQGASKVGSGEHPVGVVVKALDGWEWTDRCWWLVLAAGVAGVLLWKRG